MVRTPAPGEEFNPHKMFVGLIITEGLAASTAFSSTAKLVYGHLMRRAGKKGRCWPSAKDVAKHTGVKERAAQRALKDRQAADHPLIRATFCRDEKGRQITNTYAFIWSPILESIKKGSLVKNDTLPLSKTTPSGAVRNKEDDPVKNDSRKGSEELGQPKRARGTNIEDSSISSIPARARAADGR